jgi:hypothetical protein
MNLQELAASREGKIFKQVVQTAFQTRKTPPTLALGPWNDGAGTEKRPDYGLEDNPGK